MQTLQRLQQQLVHRWRTSLQTRVLGSILAASTVVMVLLAFVLVSFVTQNLIDSKLDVANSEIDRARVTVEQQVAATGSSSTLQTRLNAARAAVASRSGSGADGQGVYEPVIVVNNPDGSVIASPEGYRIPERLRNFVSQSQISFQFATIDRPDGNPYKALIIGTPTETDIPNLQVYLVMSMESEEATLALLRGLFSAAAVVLVVLLVGITWLLIQQVIAPVRSASRIAERFSAGHLRERMVVDGEDEMARLALSFNSMAESLSKQIRQLEEYGNLQRQFTSDVSHELRTPITTVRMAADMIDDVKDDLPPYAQRASELMVRELDRFESLLADLLEISRHDAGVADLADSEVDIRTCVESAKSQVMHLAEELGVVLNIDMPAEPVCVTADSRRIERVLRNLLANAIDHSEGRPVILTLAENDTAMAVTVVDHGVGLKPGQEELVFNRFWRADPSRVRHSGGTGLGLAISREDAVLHGGTLDAIGEPGVGTMFRLVLPKSPGESIVESPLVLKVPAPVIDVEPLEPQEPEEPEATGEDTSPEVSDKEVSAMATAIFEAAPRSVDDDMFEPESPRVLSDEDFVDEAELAEFFDPDFDDFDAPADTDDKEERP